MTKKNENIEEEITRKEVITEILKLTLPFIILLLVFLATLI